MNRRTIFVLWMMFFSLGLLWSQTNVEERNIDIGFTLGAGETEMKENVLNNIKHGGLSFSGGFYYEKSRKSTRHRIEFKFSAGSLSSRYESESATQAFNLELGYRYLRRVKSFNRNLSLFLGGSVGLNSFLAFFENWDESHFYWLTSYSLGFNGLLQFQKSDRSSFSLEIGIPFINLVSRPPAEILYKEVNPVFSWVFKQLHSNMRLVSVNQHKELKLDLAYSRRFSKGFSTRFFWQFNYIVNKLSYSEEISIITHKFGIAFLF